MAIVSVYIEEGCITCDACEETLPEVFHVTDDTCYIKADVRLDGGYDRNEGKAGLKLETISQFEPTIYPPPPIYLNMAVNLHCALPP